MNPNFPQDRLNCILKDSFGFLWAGTDRGLIRYDGRHIRWYRRQLGNPQSLSSERVWVLFEDDWGFLWVGTSNGLNRLDRRTGKVSLWHDMTGSQQALPSMNIWSIQSDDRGRLWVGTDNGLAVAEPGNLAFESVGALAGIGVTAIVQDTSGKMLIGTEHEGLRIGSDVQGEWPTIANGADLSVSRLLRRGPDVLIGTWNCGLVMRKADFWLPIETHHLADESLNVVTALTANSSGDFWVGFDKGLLRGSTRNEDWELLHHDQFPELDLVSVKALLADWDDMLWVASKRGGLHFQDQRSSQFQFRPGNDLDTLSFFQDSQNRFWVGTNNGLFRHRQDGEPLQFLKNRTINHIRELGDGRLIALSDQGVHTLDPLSGVEILVENLPFSWRFHAEGGDFFWIGTEKGLYLWHPQQGVVKHYSETTEKVALSHPLITSLDRDQDGGLWIGTFGGGVNRLDPKTENLRRFMYREDDPLSLSSNAVMDLQIGADGALWIATLDGGLNRLAPDTGDVRRWTMEQGLPDNAIVTINIDGNGNIWLATGEGLVRLDPQTHHFTTFRQDDGFYIGGALPGARWSDPQGQQMIFGGTTGAVSFNAMHFRLPPPPPLVFTDLFLDNQAFQHVMLPSETLELEQPRKSISLDVTLLDFRDQPQASVRFRREHIDDAWTAFRATRQVSYTEYLPLGGQGLLEVAGKTHYLNTVKRELTIRVKRPWWVASLPFFVLLFLALLIALVHGILSKRMRKKQRRLVQKTRLARSHQALAEARADVAEAESAIALREQQVQQEITQVLQQHLEQVSAEISNDVHDGPLGSLYSLAFQLRSLETELPPGVTKQHLIRLSQETVPAMADRLRHVCGELLKPDFGAGLQAELLNYIEVIKDQAPTLQIELIYQAHNSFAPSQLAVIYRIFRTLMKNIVKHANAAQVQIAVADKQGSLWLRVEDDGVGFAVPDRWQTFKENGHFGLYMAHYFAQSAGGTFQVVSQPGEGSRFDISLPAIQGEVHGEA